MPSHYPGIYYSFYDNAVICTDLTQIKFYPQVLCDIFNAFMTALSISLEKIPTKSRHKSTHYAIVH